MSNESPQSELSEQRNVSLWLKIAPEKLETAVAAEFLQQPRSGGINLFLGITRQWTNGRKTVLLSYEAYVAMALREMERLASHVFERWDADRVVIWHRLGDVPLAEASVLIGVATAHRAASFEATRYLIDTLKQQVPIWKKERYADGSQEWVTGSTMPATEPQQPNK